MAAAALLALNALEPLALRQIKNLEALEFAPACIGLNRALQSPDQCAI